MKKLIIFAAVALLIMPVAAFGSVDCLGDGNGDEGVNTDDMNMLLEKLWWCRCDPWNCPVMSESDEAFDIDEDGYLTTDDMNSLLMHLYFNGDPANGYEAPCM